MLRPDQVHTGLRVVTNEAKWGTVIGRTCCYHHGDGDSEHGDHVACNYWDGWWYVLDDDGRQVMQNAERLRTSGMRMFDGTYLPEKYDPKPPADCWCGHAANDHMSLPDFGHAVCIRACPCKQYRGGLR